MRFYAGFGSSQVFAPLIFKTRVITRIEPVELFVLIARMLPVLAAESTKRT